MWICWAILTYVSFGEKPLIAPVELYYSSANDNYIITWPVYYLANIGCLFGHCWPLFAQFKGGKGASCFMGTIIGASWGLGFGAALLYYFPMLKKCKYQSLTMIGMGIIEIIVTWIWAILCMTGVISGGWQWFVMYGPTLNPSWHYALIVTVIVIIMILRHHENIKRLINGTERKITWMK